MSTFASVLELGDYLGAQLAPDDPRAALMLELATGLIQSETRQTLFLVTDDIVTLVGTLDRQFWLPQGPVISVSYIKLNGATIVTGGYTWSRAGQIYRGQLPVANAPEWWEDVDASWGDLRWGGPRSSLEVKYTHGYSVIPGDIKAMCLAIAARSFGNAQNLQSENIGNYSYANQAGAPVGVTLTEDEKRVCDRYRRDGMSISVGR